MKQHILNFLFVLVIAIGGLYLMQPPTTQAQSKTCTVEEGEDPCTECLGNNCEEGDDQTCGLLEGDGEYVQCTKTDSPPVPITG
jgi:hypothetical protein